MTGPRSVSCGQDFTDVPMLTAEKEAELLSERTRICFFTGHRVISRQRLVRLTELITLQTEAFIYQGFDIFLCGGARGFDLYAGGAVVRLQKQHPSIRLVMVLPCPDQTRGWNEADRRLHRCLCEHADTFCLSADYDSGCMLRRNRFLVDHASAGLAYYTGAYRSGTAQTLRYADTCHMPVINLADMLEREEEKEQEEEEEQEEQEEQG